MCLSIKQQSHSARFGCVFANALSLFQYVAVGGSSEAAHSGRGAGHHGSSERKPLCGHLWRDRKWKNYSSASVSIWSWLCQVVYPFFWAILKCSTGHLRSKRLFCAYTECLNAHYFIWLQSCFSFSGSGIIGITEPRRVAAVSMSHRVAKEMNLSTR